MPAPETPTEDPALPTSKTGTPQPSVSEKGDIGDQSGHEENQDVDQGTETPDEKAIPSSTSERPTSSQSATIPQPTETKDDSATGNAGEEASESSNDESKHLSGLPLTLLTFGLCMATFVVALDNTIIATAIPKITTVFDSLGDVGWYGSSYLLATCSLQPMFGKIYVYFDVKWTFLFALGLFEVGSILCAAAVNSEMLIIGRAVAGAGAAAIFSGGMTIVGYAVALRKRAIYIASISSMFGISSVVGPILGGVFTDRATWRWCFWINLFFGAVAAAAVLFFFKSPDRQYAHMSTIQKFRECDIYGAFFLICAIVCLLLALQWGGTTYAWSNSKVWGCLIGFGLLIIVFIYFQHRRGERATLPARILLKQRTVFASAWFSAFLSMGLYTHIFYLPFYFQAIKGTTAEGSGIRCIAYLVSTTVSSIVVGACITAIGYYTPFMWVGSAIFTIGCGFLYTLKVDSSTGTWVGYQILAGAGAGAAVQIPFISVQVVLPEKDMPVGNAIAIFFNSLGGAIAISIAQNIFVNTLTRQLPKYAPDIPPALVIGAGATHVQDVVPKEALPGVLYAYNLAVTRAFIYPIAVAGIAFLVSLLMEWKSVKGKGGLMGAAGGA